MASPATAETTPARSVSMAADGATGGQSSSFGPSPSGPGPRGPRVALAKRRQTSAAGLMGNRRASSYPTADDTLPSAASDGSEAALKTGGVSGEPRPLSPRSRSQPSRLSMADAETRVRKQAPHLSTDPKHHLCKSQLVRGFDYLMQHQDHTAIEQLRTTLFPVLAHSLEAVLTSAVEATVNAELEAVKQRAAQAAERQAAEAGDDADCPVEELKKKYTSQATRDYADRASPGAMSPLLVSPSRVTFGSMLESQTLDASASPPPGSAPTSSDPSPQRSSLSAPSQLHRASSLRVRPLLPVGPVGGTTSAAASAAAGRSSSPEPSASNASFGSVAPNNNPAALLGEHPIILLAKELKKRAKGRDRDFDLSPQRPVGAEAAGPVPAASDDAASDLASTNGSRRTSAPPSRPMSAAKRPTGVRRSSTASNSSVKSPVFARRNSTLAVSP